MNLTSLCFNIFQPSATERVLQPNQADNEQVHEEKAKGDNERCGMWHYITALQYAA